MKTLSYTLLIFCCLSTAAFAQGRPKQKSEQVKALKVAFITSELDLTSDESAKFWPIYNAFDEKQREIRWEKVNTILGSHTKSGGEMSEKEAGVLLAQMEDNEERLHQLRKKFIANLKGVIPSVKIIKLKKAEEDFNRKLLKQYREKRKR